MDLRLRLRSTYARLVLVAILVTASALLGCASGSAFDGRDPNNLIHRVEVINDNRSDVIVYAVVGPTRYRLGNATAKQSHDFEIPEAASLDVHDLIILLQTFPATETVELGPIIPSGGTTIQVVITPRIRASRIQVN